MAAAGSSRRAIRHGEIMPVDASISFWRALSFNWFVVVLKLVLRIQGFSSEALAQCQSAADVEHKLEELEDLHQVLVRWSCSALLRRNVLGICGS